jgi:hypothetical protein
VKLWAKRSLVVIVAIGSILAIFVGARAVTGTDGSGSDPNSASGKNEVVEIVQQDGRSASKTGFSMKRTSQDTVDNVNAAAATSAGCSDCQSIAVAVQIVLITGNPSTVAPKNYAIALNTNCLRCGAMGLAYQDVITTGGPVYFTADANTQLSSLEQQIKDAADSGGSFFDVRAEIDGLVHQMWSIVASDMQHAGASYKADPKKDVQVDRTGSGTCPTDPGQATPVPTDSPSAVPLSTPSPSDSVTACPTPDVTTTPSQDPASSPSPTCTDTPVASPTPEPSPTVEPSPCPSLVESTPAPTDSATPQPTTSTIDPSPTPTATDTPVPAPTPSATPSVSPS